MTTYEHAAAGYKSGGLEKLGLFTASGAKMLGIMQSVREAEARGSHASPGQTERCKRLDERSAAVAALLKTAEGKNP